MAPDNYMALLWVSRNHTMTSVWLPCTIKHYGRFIIFMAQYYDQYMTSMAPHDYMALYGFQGTVLWPVYDFHCIIELHGPLKNFMEPYYGQFLFSMAAWNSMALFWFSLHHTFANLWVFWHHRDIWPFHDFWWRLIMTSLWLPCLNITIWPFLDFQGTKMWPLYDFHCNIKVHSPFMIFMATCSSQSMTSIAP